MAEHVTDLPPTSSAATNETEPEVIAGISSGEGTPDIPTDIRVGNGSVSFWSLLALTAIGAAIGFGAARWLRRD